MWSGDDEHVTRAAERLRTGVTFFNNHNARVVDETPPLSRFNQSAKDGELRNEGLLEFTGPTS